MKLTMTRQPENERQSTMSYLEIGSQIFHNGVPVQLLHRIRRGKGRETWRVRPLFVESPDRNEQFCASDIISFLHTIRAPRWACSA